MPKATEAFERLIGALESLDTESRLPDDAIDRILAEAPRRTDAKSLRDDPVVARFREDLSNGLVRVETAQALFQMIGDLIKRYRGF